MTPLQLPPAVITTERTAAAPLCLASSSCANAMARAVFGAAGTATAALCSAASSIAFSIAETMCVR
jgi:hypothetical protein